MPKFPDDWLGWLTLIGSIAGILAAIKLFIVNIWLNSFQINVLLALEQSEPKIISVFRKFGGGIVFSVMPKQGDVANDYWEYFMDGGKNGNSYANIIYLAELREKGYITFEYEMSNSGEKVSEDEVYTITVKGLRTAKLYKYIHMVI
ncbi:MAG: hypothetical protein ABIQ04_00300 [Candidatus Saccharimonadales bacterium]